MTLKFKAELSECVSDAEVALVMQVRLVSRLDLD